MAADPLGQLLALVADGRLSAEEAAPILAALDAQSRGGPSRTELPGEPTSDEPAGPGSPATSGSDRPGRASILRIEVRGGGRPVVSLRLPIAVGRFALDRVPGLSGDQVARVREALSLGLLGPIIEVNEGDGDGVRIALE